MILLSLHVDTLPALQKMMAVNWVYYKKGSTVPEFESAVFALPVGISINPIETRYGIHVIEVLQKQEGRQLSFEEAYPIIENHLKQQSFHHSLCDYLFELSQKADIIGIELKMNEQNIYRG